MNKDQAKARYRYLQLKKRKLELESGMRKEAQENVAEKHKSNMQYAKEVAIDAPVKLAQGATFGLSDEIYGGVMSAVGDGTYEEERDVMRGMQDKASERSPILSMASEAAGSMTTGAGANKILRTLGEGALAGLGYSREEEPVEMAKDMALGMGIAGVLHGAKEIVKYPFTDTDRTRALNLGASKMDFDNTGAMGDPRIMARNLEKAGFFSGSKGRLNTDKMKFSKKSGGDILPTRVDLEKKAIFGLKKIKREKEKILRMSTAPVSEESLVSRIIKSMEEMRKNSTDAEAFSSSAAKQVRKLLKDVKRDPSLIRLEKIKQNWQNQAQDTLESSVVNPVFKADAQIEAKISTMIKEEIEASVHGLDPKLADKFLKLNELGSNLHQAKRGLRKAISASDAGGSGIQSAFNPYASPVLQGVKASEFMAGGEKGTLLRARTGDIMSKIPDEVTGQMSIAPVRAAAGREPQSIPEEVVRYKIPRTTEEVIANADVIKMKIAQQVPEMYDDIVEVLDNQPDKISDLLPMIQTVAPHLLEDDRYGRIDGVIIDPVKKQMAREDLNLNDDLSNSQRMLMMNELNRTGEFEL